MSEPGETAAAGEERLRDSAGTGRDTVVRVRAFEVVSVQCADKWDPSEEALAVSYHVQNRNERAVSGRIVYYVPDPSEPPPSDRGTGQIAVHTQSLTQEQFTEGAHELAESERWDGTIDQGLEDRQNERITADLSTVRVVVELWDHSDDAPERQEQHLSRAHTHVHIDAIAEGRWDCERCIPYIETNIGDLESELMSTKMIARVKNIREGTAVRIMIARISDPTSS